MNRPRIALGTQGWLSIEQTRQVLRDLGVENRPPRPGKFLLIMDPPGQFGVWVRFERVDLRRVSYVCGLNP